MSKVVQASEAEPAARDLSEAVDMSETGRRIAKRGRSQVRGRGLDYVARSSRYEVDADSMAQWPPNLVEIGFGTGESVLAVAAERPELRILAVDIYERGAARLLRLLDEGGLANVRVSSQDARTVLNLLPSGHVDEIRAFFPDPWPKRKHRERRLIEAQFLERAAEVLRPGGIFWLATDSADYAAQVRGLCAQLPLLTEVDPSAVAAVRPSTKYARRAIELGHTCVDLIWQRSASR
jgi:tRNA (guanine-N7-)-methyltransferase